MLTQLRQSFDQLPRQRQMILGAVVVGVVGALLLVARWASQPDMALLFGNLAPQDAGRVVEQLEADGTRFELRDGGTSVFVPKDRVYGLRVSMATAGVVTDGPAGYELFDGGTLGMTDFMQRLNVKRALEGELARTISAIRQVERARVHLVLPERSAFREQQTSATASVVLAVRGQLAPDQTAGIAALVAGAVEGMDPSEVTVLDEGGRMLTGPSASGADAGLSTAQIRMRAEVEDHLATAGQSMLDQLLGPGRAVVRVAADLDLSSTVVESNTVDPESQTLISEERQQEAGEGVGAESTVRNFELSRETTRAQRDAGAIRTLTVSVLLDEAAPPAVDRPREPGEPTPFSDEQLRQIESLVKNAVGYDEERGDRFAVQQIRFTAPPEVETSLLAGVDGAGLAGVGVRYGLMLLALFLGYRLLRRLTDRLTESADDEAATPARPGLAVSADGELLGVPDDADDEPARPDPSRPEPPPAEPDDAPRTTIDAVDDDPYAAKLRPDAALAAAAAALDRARQSVDDDPAAAAAVVRAWLLEDAAV